MRQRQHAGDAAASLCIQVVGVVAEDVTAQGADLDARIEALEVSIARLRQLLATAETTKDLIDIESELTARQAELDSLVAQRAVLSDQVAQSTLTVSISPSSESPTWTPPGFVSGLESGWNALRTVTATLVTLAGFLLPFVGALAVIAVHAAAAHLHQALAHAAQAGQVKLGVAVGAAHAFGLGRREHTAGADHLAGGLVAHQQVFAEVVEQVDVVAGQCVGQARTHLGGKHVEPQFLRLLHLALVPGPGDLDAVRARCHGNGHNALLWGNGVGEEGCVHDPAV